LVLTPVRWQVSSAAGWCLVIGGLAAGVAGSYFWLGAGAGSEGLSLGGISLLIVGILCLVRGFLRLMRRVEVVCDRNGGTAARFEGKAARRENRPSWRKALGKRVACRPIAAPTQSRARDCWWVEVYSLDAPSLLLEGRWSEEQARAVAAALESYFGACEGGPVDTLLREVPEAPPFPSDSALYCTLVGEAFVAELPRKGPVKSLMAVAALAGVFWWAYAAYLFQGPFDAAWASGAYGAIALVTVLFGLMPLLLVGLVLAHGARKRAELVLEGPFVVYRQTGLLGVREVVLHVDHIAEVEQGLETLGGNERVVRLRHGDGVLELGHGLGETDLRWLESALHFRLAGGQPTALASQSRAVSQALVAQPKRNGAFQLAVERLRDDGGAIPEPPPPPTMRARLDTDADRLSIDAPARGLTVYHAGIVGAALAAGLLLGGYWLLAVVPAGLGVLYDATRRTRLEAGPEGVSVKTTWQLGSRTWQAPLDTVQDFSLYRSTLRPGALLAGEGYVLRTKGPEGEADFGHGLSRKELAWLRDRAVRASAWGPDGVNALDTLDPTGEGTDQTLPSKGPLNAAEYLSHTLGRAMDTGRYFVLELDRSPVDQRAHDARKMADLTILGTFAAALIPLGGYGVYLGLVDPGAASLYRIPLGVGLVALMPGVLLASLYRDVLIVDRAGRLAVQAKTLLLPPALLPATLVQHAARRGQVHDLDSFDGVGIVTEADEAGEPYFAVRLEGAAPLVVKRQRDADAARAYGRALARFAGLELAQDGA